MKKQLRVGKIFVDWSQNDEHKTTISVYSLRARERPTVSTPVTWDEVAKALSKKDANLLVFEANQVLDRVQKMGDLFEPVYSLKQKLPKLSGITEISVAEKGLDIAAQAEDRGIKKTAKKAKPPVRRASSKKKSRKV
jgi:bifunctional non-homologous end joining protein LigD